jgi:hypothetical protein
MRALEALVEESPFAPGPRTATLGRGAGHRACSPDEGLSGRVARGRARAGYLVEALDRGVARTLAELGRGAPDR